MPAELQHKTMPGLRAADARARQAVALLITCTVIQRWDQPVVFASVLHDASWLKAGVRAELV